jgi:hypothetical protein
MKNTEMPVSCPIRGTGRGKGSTKDTEIITLAEKTREKER